MEKLQYSFSKISKASMTTILDKYSNAPPHHGEVRASLQVPGDVVLWPNEALYLAGVIQPYYSFLSDRLRNHPGLAPETQLIDYDDAISVQPETRGRLKLFKA